MRKTVKSMVDEATAAITTYSVEEARDLHGREDVQFIDIRDVRELEREGVFLEDGLVGPAPGPVKLGYHRLTIFQMHLVDTVLIGAQGHLAAVPIQTYTGQGVKHPVRRQGFEGMNARGRRVGSRHGLH